MSLETKGSLHGAGWPCRKYDTHPNAIPNKKKKSPSPFLTSNSMLHSGGPPTELQLHELAIKTFNLRISIWQICWDLWPVWVWGHNSFVMICIKNICLWKNLLAWYIMIFIWNLSAWDHISIETTCAQAHVLVTLIHFSKVLHVVS